MPLFTFCTPSARFICRAPTSAASYSIPKCASTAGGRRSRPFCTAALQFVPFFVVRFMAVVFFSVPQIDEDVGREIINHRSLRHHNIFLFKEVRGIRESYLFLSLISVYARGQRFAIFFSFCRCWSHRRTWRSSWSRPLVGNCSTGSATPRGSARTRLRYFFQQLICSVNYCYQDLKLENTMLDSSPTPQLKICDFGYSKVTNCMHLSVKKGTFFSCHCLLCCSSELNCPEASTGH
jgi:serine/threonine protein kinase